MRGPRSIERWRELVLEPITRPAATGQCAVCGAGFTGRSGQKYCGRSCRQRAHRRGPAVAKPSVSGAGASSRRLLAVLPRSGEDSLWPAVLIDDGRRLTFELSPVGSWHGVLDAAATFEVDEIKADPDVLADMATSGVGPARA